MGRPSKMTPDVVAKLEEAFCFGLSDAQASLFAGIDPSTLYRHCQDNEYFRQRKELLKEQPKIKAKIVIAQELNDNNESVARWYLERRDKDFTPHHKSEHQIGGTFKAIFKAGDKVLEIGADTDVA